MTILVKSKSEVPARRALHEAQCEEQDRAATCRASALAHRALRRQHNERRSRRLRMLGVT